MDHRIVFVAPFPPPYGGMGVRFDRLVHALAQHGHQCQRVRLEWVEGEQYSFPLLHRFVAFLKASADIVRSDAELVHCVTGSVGNFVAISTVLMAARLTRRPSLLSLGGGSWATRAGISGLLQAKMYRLIFSLATRVIACNQELENEVLALGVPPNKVHMISNALPDEVGDRLVAPLPEDFLDFKNAHSPLLLYVGAMTPKYGLLDVIEAVSNLKTEWPDLGLIALVKKGWNKEYSGAVEQRLQVDLKDSVAIYTSVPWSVAAMLNADALVRAVAGEGDSRAVREALAVGLPVVASDVGHRPSGVTTYQSGNIRELTQALDSVLRLKDRPVPFVDPEGEENISRYERLYTELKEANRTQPWIRSVIGS